MNKNHKQKDGERTTPEFKEEAIVFIHMDVVLPEFEEGHRYSTPIGVTPYNKEDLDKWK